MTGKMCALIYVGLGRCLSTLSEVPSSCKTNLPAQRSRLVTNWKPSIRIPDRRDIEQ
jgi:hypothetical protein